jgi:hypothetical protein
MALESFTPLRLLTDLIWPPSYWTVSTVLYCTVTNVLFVPYRPSSTQNECHGFLGKKGAFSSLHLYCVYRRRKYDKYLRKRTAFTPIQDRHALSLPTAKDHT